MYSGNVDEMKRFEGQHVPKCRDIIKRARLSWDCSIMEIKNFNVNEM